MPSSARAAAAAAAAALQAARAARRNERRPRRRKKAKSRGAPGCFLTALELPLADDSQRKLLDVARALVGGLPEKSLIVFPGRTAAAARELSSMRAEPALAGVQMRTVQDIVASQSAADALEGVRSIVCCGASPGDARRLLDALGDTARFDTIAFIVPPAETGGGGGAEEKQRRWDDKSIPYCYVLLPIAASGLSKTEAFLIYDASVESEPSKKPWKVRARARARIIAFVFSGRGCAARLTRPDAVRRRQVFENYAEPRVICESRSRPNAAEIEDALYYHTQKNVASTVSEAVDSSPLGSLASQLSSTFNNMLNRPGG